MADCVLLSREMLKNPIHLSVPEPLNFSRARVLAERKAAEMGTDPTLLAWYKADTGEFSPRVTCCHDDKPAWLIYAESRGGDLVIDINEEEFVFVFKDAG